MNVTKKIFSGVLLALCVALMSGAAGESSLKEVKNPIVFDIDGVLVKEPASYKKQMALVLGGIWRAPLNVYNWISCLLSLKAAYKQRDPQTGKKTIMDRKGNAINGLGYQLLYFATQKSGFDFYAPWMIKKVESLRTPIEKTVKIAEYLKSKGHPIVFATNKDALSYKAFIKSTDSRIKNLPDMVFVAGPDNSIVDNAINQLAASDTTHKEYKDMVAELQKMHSEPKMTIIKAVKPNASYFDTLSRTMKEKYSVDSMIFIDDTDANVKGFNEYVQQSMVLPSAQALQFDSADQLIEQLIELKVLSLEDDKTFINSLQ